MTIQRYRSSTPICGFVAVPDTAPGGGWLRACRVGLVAIFLACEVPMPTANLNDGETTDSGLRVAAIESYTGAAAIEHRLGFLRDRLDVLQSEAETKRLSATGFDLEHHAEGLANDIERLEGLLRIEKLAAAPTSGTPSGLSANSSASCTDNPTVEDAGLSISAFPSGVGPGNSRGFLIGYWTEVDGSGSHAVYISHEGDVNALNGHVDEEQSSCSSYFGGSIELVAPGSAAVCASARATHRVFNGSGYARGTAATDAGEDCLEEDRDWGTLVRPRRR